MSKPRYAELIVYRAYANLRAEAAKTYIGFLWWVLDPIIFMAIFYVVFALLLQRRTENFIAFLLVGLVSWRWFQNTISNGSNSVLHGRTLMRQVYLPKLIFPLVSILMDLFKFTLVFVLLLIYLWISGFNIGIAYFALPFVILIQFFLVLGITCLVASLVPMLPDLSHLVSHVLQLMLYISGIFYSGKSIPDSFKFYFYLNPMANLIEAYRDILMYNHWPAWGALLTVTIFSLLAVLISYIVFTHYDYEYPKLVA